MAKKRTLDDPFATTSKKEGLLPTSEAASTNTSDTATDAASKSNTASKSSKSKSKKAKKSIKARSIDDPFTELLEKEGLLPSGDGSSGTPKSTLVSKVVAKQTKTTDETEVPLSFDTDTLLTPINQQFDSLSQQLLTRLNAIEAALQQEHDETDEEFDEDTEDAASEALEQLLGRLEAIEESLQALQTQALQASDQDEAPDYTFALDQLYEQVQKLLQQQEAAAAQEDPWQATFQEQLQDLTAALPSNEGLLQEFKQLQARLESLEEALEQAPTTLANTESDQNEVQLSEDDREAIADIQDQLKALYQRLEERVETPSGNATHDALTQEFKALTSRLQSWQEAQAEQLQSWQEAQVKQLQASQEAQAEQFQSWQSEQAAQLQSWQSTQTFHQPSTDSTETEGTWRPNLAPLEAQIEALQQQLSEVSDAQETAIEAQSKHLASQLTRWQEQLPAQIAALVPVPEHRPSLLGTQDIAMPDGLLPNFAFAPESSAPSTALATQQPAPAIATQHMDLEALYHADRQAYSRNFGAVIGTVLVVIFLCGMTLWLPKVASKWASFVMIMGQFLLTLSGIFSLQWLARERNQIERRIADHERKLKREQQLATTLEPFPVVLHYVLMSAIGLWWFALLFIK